MHPFKLYRHLKDVPTIEGLDLEYAVTREEQEKGLMSRDSLPKNSGMLFIYPRPARLAFWMKNTKIPLDIIFIDEQGYVNGIDYLQPLSLDKVYSPPQTKYALEVNHGWAKQNNIKVGQKVL